MSLIENLGLDDRPVTELELRELYNKYELAFIEESDDDKSEELYELSLYLMARLEAIKAVQEDESKDVRELRHRIEELEAENRALYKRLAGNSENEFCSKQDIMTKFQKGSDWALRLLRLMYQNGQATKMGREYYAKEQDISELVMTYKGKALAM